MQHVRGSFIIVCLISPSGISRAAFHQISHLLAARCHMVHTSTKRTSRKKTLNASPTTWCPWRSQKPQQKPDPHQTARPPFSKVGNLQKIPPTAALVWTWNRVCTKICRLGECQPARCPSVMWSLCGLIGAWSLARRSTPETKLRSGTGCQRWTLPSSPCWSLFSWIRGRCAAKPSRTCCSFHKKPTTPIYRNAYYTSVHFIWYL